MSPVQRLPDSTENALQNYARQLVERDRLQRRLCGHLERAAQDLLMNSGDPFRFFEETRAIIDRCIPLVEGIQPGRGGEDLSGRWGGTLADQTQHPTMLSACPPGVDGERGGGSQVHREESEFWTLPERIGDEDRGIQRTLTITEKGYPQAMERVGHPRFSFLFIPFLHLLSISLNFPSPQKGNDNPCNNNPNADGERKGEV